MVISEEIGLGVEINIFNEINISIEYSERGKWEMCGEYVGRESVCIVEKFVMCD